MLKNKPMNDNINLLMNEDNNEQPKGTQMINCNFYESVLKLCSHTENESHRCSGVCVNYNDC